MTKTELDCKHLKTLTESKTLHDNLIAKRNVEKVTNRVMDTTKRLVRLRLLWQAPRRALHELAVQPVAAQIM